MKKWWGDGDQQPEPVTCLFLCFRVQEMLHQVLHGLFLRVIPGWGKEGEKDEGKSECYIVARSVSVWKRPRCGEGDYLCQWRWLLACLCCRIALLH